MNLWVICANDEMGGIRKELVNFISKFRANLYDIDVEGIRRIKTVDAVIIIIGNSTGSIDSSSRSRLEIEWETARKLDVPKFVFRKENEEFEKNLENDPNHPNSRLISEVTKTEKLRKFRTIAQIKDILLENLFSGSHFANSSNQQSNILSDVKESITKLDEKIEIYRENNEALLQQTPSKKSQERNLQVKPAPILGEHCETNLDNCFIAMPYSEPWSETVMTIIRSAVKEAGFVPVIGKEMDGRIILNDIWTGITGSLVVIGDLTLTNPNVCYEIGLCDVIGKELILISQELDIPFDFSSSRIINYSIENELGRSELKRNIVSRLRKLKIKLS